MPKTASQKLRKQAVREQPASKKVFFWFEGGQKMAEINPRDSPNAILGAFAFAAGVGYDIEIVDDAGVKLPLRYSQIKNNGKVHVRRAVRTQGAMGAGVGATRTRELLNGIISNWKLNDACEIFGNQEFAPREKNLAGGMTTLAEDGLLTHPVTWTSDFTTTLHQLSTVTVHRHAEALRAMMNAAVTRMNTLGDPQKEVQEVMTRDVRAAIEAFSNLRVADDAYNVAMTERMVGGLSGALPDDHLMGMKALGDSLPETSPEGPSSEMTLPFR